MGKITAYRAINESILNEIFGVRPIGYLGGGTESSVLRPVVGLPCLSLPTIDWPTRKIRVRQSQVSTGALSLTV
ncbi:uncharacterized protein BO80DRAFT_446699 [Aspergillus ibericus CBS 121593]|uniref:Uncharacterized protein n=1 Tax=Aspergillus ibericus CBS 121593 TaxID=1448316 RepID=A0A395GVF5_9EURO|nr:hypothetical protein BO80DRAFT_446699 [Aspergillus ibericus CBS 121593]RAK99134.1 hypothetical protein BO80DRAFT_446699 [Aspergillus ibericus CBS 121593]